MPVKYNPSKIEKKWQAEWERKKLYQTKESSKKEKYYVLFEFPYPSGEGLHVGHIRPYVAMDIVAHKRRMEGYNVLFPIGWDAFGLPTEQFAIKNNVHPRIVTKKNTDNFRRQLKALGFSFDWAREINTSDPKYYMWTQWIFLQLFHNGLAYKARTVINWCPQCRIGLANEEIEQGHCERCGGEVEEREKEQWMLKITAYAEQLLSGLNEVDYIEEIKNQQRHWIGKSEGARISFELKTKQEKQKTRVEVFTTRPDTIYGATFLVLGPEHRLLLDNELEYDNREEVERYREAAKKKTLEERMAEKDEKTGVRLASVMAVNPATGEEMPVWVADYVLGNVGTGAIMAVPAHDERDFAFAKKYWLDVVPVIMPKDAHGDTALHIVERLRGRVAEEVYTGRGRLMHSREFDGMDSELAKRKIVKKLGGAWETQYRLRDWIFSRQRYWGEPIPLIFCPACKEKPAKKSSKGERLNPGWIPVPEKDLPVDLPDVKNYEPRDDGESPLASVEEWVKAKCPRCGSKARRETDTMPNWAGSSWYFLRYADPANTKAFAGKKKLAYWMPVDWYNGGMEHATRHLLYSRFWNQFLFDHGLVPVSEPYKKRTAHGLIVGEGGVKMSKSKGNVVRPDGLAKQFGADALRLYEMFIGPFDQAVAWDSRGIVGMRRFLERVWNFALCSKLKHTNTKAQSEHKKLERRLHQTIKKVSDDIEHLRMNTAVSALMILLNDLEAVTETAPKEYVKIFLRLLSPFAPHITEELWAALGEKKSIHTASWPAYQAERAQEEMFQLVIQVNGKVRAVVEAPAALTKREAEQLALSHERVIKIVGGKKPKNMIFVPGRLVNIVL